MSDQFKMNQRVNHTRYGEGTLVCCIEFFNHVMAEVQFDSAPPQTLHRVLIEDLTIIENEKEKLHNS